MTQNETKELFQQLKRDDELSAPSFASVMNAAVANGQKTSGRWRPFRLVMVPAALLLALGGGWLWVVQREEILLPPDPPELSTKAFCNCPTEPVVARPIVARNAEQSKVVRHKCSALRQPINVLVSQWHSPTEFLLKTPSERWMKEVPKLGVPRMDIKSLDFEQKNEMEEQ